MAAILSRPLGVNSSPPSAAYMRPWAGSTLVQVMACRLFGAKPLPEPMLTFCQLDPQEQTSVKFESTKFPTGEIAFEKVVYEMVAILSRGYELMFTFIFSSRLSVL